jgi:hypothetical protein
MSCGTESSTAASVTDNPNYPKTPPANQTLAAPIALYGCSSQAYSVPVVLNNERFNLLLDTGSSATAVASTVCTAEKGCDRIKPLYEYGSGQVIDANVTEINYGYGAYKSFWQGIQVKEEVSLEASLSSVSMHMGAIHSTSLNTNNTLAFLTPQTCFADDGNIRHTMHGIFGLGSSVLNQGSAQGLDAWIEKAIAKDANYGQYSVLLCDLNGLYWQQGIDRSYFTGEPIYIPMQTNGYYSIRISSLTLEGENEPFAKDLWSSLIDTGTSNVELSSSNYLALMNQLNRNPNAIALFGKTFFKPNNTQCFINEKPENISREDIDNRLPRVIMNIKNSLGQMESIYFKATAFYLNAVAVHATPNIAAYCLGVGDAGNLGASSYSAIVGNIAMNNSLYIFDVLKKQLGIAYSGKCNNLR